ncbi:MAG: hypothetical protein AAGM22_26145 [Acidobacteriota bacterium]
MCALDVVPAATLLLPYFEVDLDDPDPPAIDTLFSINNASPEPTIVNVTFWTNYGLPTLGFDIFLTGFDVQVVNMREAFNGNLPVTADAQTDPDDTISPHGANPEWDGSFTAPPDCANFFPYFNPVIPQQNLERMINGHTGKPVAAEGGLCTGRDLGDNVARGYVTMDVASRCSIEFPTDNGYFGGFDPVATDDNLLWGEFIIRAPDGSFGRSELVHIEADPSFDGSTTESGYTFYGRYTDGQDHREPLGTQWAARYAGGSGPTESRFLVWRDSTDTDPPINGGYDCDTGQPAWFPLEENSVLCFDEEENVVELCEGEACFPLETQSVVAGGTPLSTPFPFGWCRLDLTHDDDFPTDEDYPVSGSPIAQSYVTVMHDEDGSFSSMSRAMTLEDACVGVDSFQMIFKDGFESGDTTRWSAQIP